MSCVEKCLYIFLLTFIIEIPVTYSKQFRTDYVYNRKTDAFYKFHIESVWFSRAESICQLEGATVMIPTSDNDVSQVHGMFKSYPDLGNFVWVGYDGKTHESAEEQPLINLDDLGSRDMSLVRYDRGCDVLTRDGEIKTYECYRTLPFVCKVEANQAYFDNRCMVYGRDYQYFANVSSCYKIPRLPYSWDQAYDECRAEGAHLAILNSDLERQVLRNFLKSTPSVPGAQATFFFFVGIRAQKKIDGSPIVFKTVFNETLEEAGYSHWSDNEPNNALQNEYCGTIFIADGKYNDVYCGHFYAFICESEVKELSKSIQ
ncbi:lymphocyte antigen 75-like [Vanessa atalanta]|uniref:lymphocyte antigen 75-like n=1 Tax=Vanessa atalanta TaxID=42275 RepID=UPI001FCDF184|nr:lymphocyte antigen 75-like [Vanessa atalanta]